MGAFFFVTPSHSDSDGNTARCLSEPAAAALEAARSAICKVAWTWMEWLGGVVVICDMIQCWAGRCNKHGLNGCVCVCVCVCVWGCSDPVQRLLKTQKKPGSMLFLHAHTLALPHPLTGEPLVLQAPLSSFFAQVCICIAACARMRLFHHTPPPSSQRAGWADCHLWRRSRASHPCTTTSMRGARRPTCGRIQPSGRRVFTRQESFSYEARTCHAGVKRGSPSLKRISVVPVFDAGFHSLGLLGSWAFTPCAKNLPS